jgi:hypothetical protein
VPEAPDRASFKGSLTLTNTQWREIVAIRPPRVPEADARAAIDFIRDIYLPLKSVTAERKELGSIVTLAKRLEAKLRKREDARQAIRWQQLEQNPYEAKQMPPEHKVIGEVRARYEQRLEGLKPAVPQPKDRKLPLEQRLLLQSLFKVWVVLFGGTLTVTDPEEGTPSGELVDFIRIATAGISPPINPYTIGNLTPKQAARRRKSAARRKPSTKTKK